ncbi:MAG: DUF4339 domain-containing protein [Sulfuritalea sp.]|nr:DUF4339 domain-containing protein [Sulfuritalea sp.]
MSTWYYCRNGQQNGPVSLDELKGLIARGELDGSTFVWQVGMSEWVKVRRHPQLAGLVSTSSALSDAAAWRPPPKRSIRRTLLEVIGSKLSN